MIGRKPHVQRRRRWFAATACVLWLLGVEVLPNLHLAFHADDHTHGADGTIVHVVHDEHEHEHEHEHDHHAAHADAHHDAHADAHHDHDHDAAPAGHRPHRERTDGASALDHAPSAHAAAGVAHHAIALHRPPPPLLEPLPVLRAAWRLEHEPERSLHDALRARPNARGPPATA